ncbi:hypothetical protein HPP92_012903 [Vanilla planifolia]|uniref:Uncharacterized protein n=1 Tax=Vanilla planifolia TaxID=51239 RepID=A0A835QXQ8_VANPL|nr:hypothetical protein HPP92_012903 [Vanilla planifolia]
MAIFNCLVMFLMTKKKKSKIKAADVCDEGISSGKLQVKPVNNTSLSSENHIQESHLATSKASPSQEKRSFFIPKVLSDDSLVRAEFSGEAAYEGGDEHDEIGSMKRDYSYFDLQAKEEPISYGLNAELNNLTSKNNMEMEKWISGATRDASGHVSDPGMVRTNFWGSPALKRSCSNIETKRVNRLINSVKWPSSYNNFQNLLENGKGGISYECYSSPLTVKSSCSADRVMLKKRSSCQVLPSRSKKIWWKLFLWSHRNLHKPSAPKQLLDFSTTKPKFGYSSDTHEPCKKLDNKKKKTIEAQNQWLAFSLESSSFDRVNAWVNSLDDSTFYDIDGEENIDGLENVGALGPHQLDIGESSMKIHSHASQHVVEDILQANNIIQSLNSFSSVAHISGIGLKVIPFISAFINLRTVNLSANFIGIPL